MYKKLGSILYFWGAPGELNSIGRGAEEIKFRRERGAKKFADFPSPYFLNGIVLK